MHRVQRVFLTYQLLFYPLLSSSSMMGSYLIPCQLVNSTASNTHVIIFINWNEKQKKHLKSTMWREKIIWEIILKRKSILKDVNFQNEKEINFPDLISQLKKKRNILFIFQSTRNKIIKIFQKKKIISTVINIWWSLDVSRLILETRRKLKSVLSILGEIISNIEKNTL